MFDFNIPADLFNQLLFLVEMQYKQEKQRQQAERDRRHEEENSLRVPAPR